MKNCTNNFYKVEEMDKLLVIYILPRLNQEEIDNLNTDQ